MFHLTIQLPHEERQVEISTDRVPRRLTDILRGIDLPLNTRCGQRGLCDGCLLELRQGQLLWSSTGKVIEATNPAQSLRGCEVSLPESGRAVVHVPSRSLLAHQPQVVTSFRLNVPRAHDPLWQSLRITPAELAADKPLCDALRFAVAAQWEGSLPLELDTTLDALAPRSDGAYHVALEHRGDHWVLKDLDVTEPAFGVAVDIGTTTVVVIVVELATGRVVGTASALNAQTRLGDNVLTRINLCMQEPHIVGRMQKAIVRGTLSPLLGQALLEAAVEPDQLACMVVAGNTTMLHLLCGVDPTSMGTAPFTPTFLEHRMMDAAQLRMQVKSPRTSPSRSEKSHASLHAATDGVGHVAVHTLPGAAAYVGADITAGVLATGMAYRDDTCLLVDLGTNGEIVLKHNGQLLGCATAAGPAFEGAGLSYGVRAGQGAIGHIWLERDSSAARVEVIGGGPAIGLCGTAYIDFVARARQIGLITPTARFVSDRAPGVFKHPSHGWSFPVAPGQDAEPLLITEADMASLLQAKAAIAAGVTCLLRRADLQAAQVSTVYLAGGFGFHMHIDSLLGCGLLPDFRPEQIELVGNTSLAGAYLTLVDSTALREIRQLSRRMTVVELNLEPDFEMIYIDQLSLA
ncbi:MAG: ASKHA domain-containing protein [Pirellulaceae bacterium]